MEKGLIHIYYGDGKGKTTAAMGLAVRAAGRGLRVLIFQFMKDNDSGERAILEKIPFITCMQGRQEEKFSFNMNEQELAEASAFYQKKFQEIKEWSGQFDMVLLDEAITAVGAGFIEEKTLIEFLEENPGQLEIVVTGHHPSEEILVHGDYVTEMKKIRHPFDNGTVSRKGIEC